MLQSLRNKTKNGLTITKNYFANTSKNIGSKVGAKPILLPFFVTEKAGFEPTLIVNKSIVACVLKFRVACRVARALFVHFYIATNPIGTKQFLPKINCAKS